MTAPTRTRRKAPEKSRVDSLPEQAPATERRQGPRRTSAAERAYARRAQRAEAQRVEGLWRAGERPQRVRRLWPRWPRSRASFVLLVMTLLATGVATTLLLSTQAIADSYRLEQIGQENANLAERSQQLQQDVNRAGSASSLADRARALGMVPAGDPAHLVQNPDGSVTVVGDPEKVVAPPAPAPAPPAAPAPPPAAQNPAAQNPAAQNPAAQNPAAQNPAAQNPAAQNPGGQAPATQSPGPQSPAPGVPIEGDVPQGDQPPAPAGGGR